MSRPKDDSLTCLCLRKLLSTLRGLVAFPALPPSGSAGSGSAERRRARRLTDRMVRRSASSIAAVLAVALLWAGLYHLND
jgi:hypothetical protein